MSQGTRYPHGLKSPDVKVGKLTANEIDCEELTVNGEAYNRKVATVDVTNNAALPASDKYADTIVISTAGTDKVLTLGMAEGKIVLILNNGAKSVTVKNKAADTGGTATNAKMALFYIHALDVVKLSADVSIPSA